MDQPRSHFYIEPHAYAPGYFALNFVAYEHNQRFLTRPLDAADLERLDARVDMGLCAVSVDVGGRTVEVLGTRNKLSFGSGSEATPIQDTQPVAEMEKLIQKIVDRQGNTGRVRHLNSYMNDEEIFRTLHRCSGDGKFVIDMDVPAVQFLQDIADGLDVTDLAMLHDIHVDDIDLYLKALPDLCDTSYGRPLVRLCTEFSPELILEVAPLTEAISDACLAYKGGTTGISRRHKIATRKALRAASDQFHEAMQELQAVLGGVTELAVAAGLVEAGPWQLTAKQAVALMPALKSRLAEPETEAEPDGDDPSP